MGRRYFLGNALCLLALQGLLSSCGYGQYQTARTVLKGDVRFTIAQNVLHNKNQQQLSETNFWGPVSHVVGNWAIRAPQEIRVRIGAGERTDVGVALFLAGGLLVDAKVNLMPTDHDLAIAVQGGVGGALDTASWRDGDKATVWHIPLGVLASYRLWSCFSPYLGAAYHTYWFVGRPLPDEIYDPQADYVDRKYHGDGVLRLTIGFEHHLNSRFAWLAEYTLLYPVLDDPGDNYAFVTNHLWGLGLAF